MGFVGPTPLEVQLQQQRMLMGLIQTFAEMRQRKRQEELGLQQQGFENQMREREFGETQKYHKTLGDYYQGQLNAKAAPPDPTDWDKKVKYAQDKIASGEWDEQTARRALFGGDTEPKTPPLTPDQIKANAQARAQGTVAGGMGPRPREPKPDPNIKRRESYGKELRAINRYYDGLATRLLPGQPTDTIEAARKKQITQLNKDYADILNNMSESQNEGRLGGEIGDVISGGKKDKYQVGQTVEMNGAIWEYIGNDQWRKKKS